MPLKRANEADRIQHPRAVDCRLLPRRLGASIIARPAWMSRLDRWFSRGRHIQSNSLAASSSSLPLPPCAGSGVACCSCVEMQAC